MEKTCNQLISFLKPEQLRSPEGLPTGLSALDNFLLWKGLPKGALSHLGGYRGLGSTSLCIQTAGQITRQKKHVAWVEDTLTWLNPWNLRRQGVCLERLFWISTPTNLKQRLWILQELCHLDLFEMIACSLEQDLLKDHQLLKLKRLAQRHHTAIVFLSQRSWSHPYFALSLSFQKDRLLVLRALHRPTPHPIERRALYAHTLPEFVSERKSLRG